MSDRTNRDARILVVDDDESIVRLLVRTLKGAGYTQVSGTSDSTGVPAYLDSVDPDLVTLDLNMPGLDGSRFWKRSAHGSRTMRSFPFLR